MPFTNNIIGRLRACKAGRLVAVVLLAWPAVVRVRKENTFATAKTAAARAPPR